jgi:hypothetical protein
MPATNTTLSAVQKNWYLDGLIDELNQNFAVLTKYKKSGKLENWSGKNLTVLARTGRNEGGGNTSDGGALGTAGNQSYVDLVLNAKLMYKPIQISRSAIRALEGGQKGSFLNYLEAEVSPTIKNDIPARANFEAIYGGPTKGSTNEHKVGAVTTADDAAGAATDVLDWSGLRLDASYFMGNPFAAFTDFSGAAVLAATAATAATWRRVRLFRGDTYAEIFPETALGVAGTAANSAFFVSATDSDNAQVTIRTVVNDGTNRRLNTLNPVAVAMPAGVGVIIAMNPTQFVDSGAAAFGRVDSDRPGGFGTFTIAATATSGSTSTGAVVGQHTGIFHNLFSQAHFGVDRTSATGEDALQSSLLTVAQTGNHIREPLSRASIQRTLGKIGQLSGMKPDFAVLSYEDQQILWAELYAEQRNYSDQGGATKVVNAGYEITQYSFGQVKEWACDQSVGRSQIIFMSFADGAWKLCQIGGDAALIKDGKGNTVFPSMSISANLMMVEWEYDTLCAAPNRNAVLIGYEI